MLKSFKYRLYPTNEQKQHFAKAMGCVRYIYNKALEAKIKYYEISGETLSYFDLQNILLIEEKRVNEWLKEPCSQSL